MPDINIRRATINDALGIAKVQVDVWHATYTGIIPQKVLDERTYDNKCRPLQKPKIILHRN